jgi:hypothetical protein
VKRELNVFVFLFSIAGDMLVLSCMVYFFLVIWSSSHEHKTYHLSVSGTNGTRWTRLMTLVITVVLGILHVVLAGQLVENFVS